MKAVLLSKVLDFVYWPDSAAGQRRLCVLGEDPFGDELEAAFAGRSDMTLERHAGELATVPARCDVVYISDSLARDYEALLEAAAERPVLTISDIPRFALNGGMINMALVNRRVRFRINQQELESAGIEVSYKLLRLADIVDADKEGSQG